MKMSWHVQPKTDVVPPSKQTAARSWLHIIDGVTSVTLLVAAAGVIWTTFLKPPPSRPEPKPPSALQSLEGANLRGNPNARVGIIEYSDFECPYCGAFARDVFPRIDERYIKSGRVVFGFRHFPLEKIHSFALDAAKAAECAGRQGKFWEMHDLLFENQKQLDLDNLLLMAGDLSLDSTRMQVCMHDQVAVKIQRDIGLANSLQFGGTPAFLLGTVQAGGMRITKVMLGSRPLADFATVLDSLLQRTAN
jgi:protein-disulfide isomerase